MKKVISFLLVALTIISMFSCQFLQVFAEEVEEPEYYLRVLQNGTAVLYSYNGYKEYYEVPQYYPDYPDNEIIGIWKDAFSGNDSLRSIVINSNIIEIRERAFKDCVNLKNVELNADLDYIYEETFSGCTSLETIVLPDSIKELDPNAFANCSSLKEIFLPKNLTYTGGAFSGCNSLKTVYYSGSESDWQKIQFTNNDSNIMNQTNIIYNYTHEQAISKNNKYKFEKIELGSSHTAAINKNHELYMWGSNKHGEIGDGSSEEICTTPKKIMSNVKDVSVGCLNSAAVTENGDLYIWGNIGNGKGGKPVFVTSNVKSVVLSNATSGRYAYITTTNDLYVCGSNYCGQVGNGTTEPVETPQKILSNVNKVVLHEHQSAAITCDGQFYIWGTNTGFIVGGPDEETYLYPHKMFDNAIDIFLGLNNTAVLTNENSGKMYIWGSNSRHQIGNGDYHSVCANPYAAILSYTKQIACADQTTIAVGKNGDLWTWGESRYEYFDIRDGDYYHQKSTEDVKYYVPTGNLTSGYLINYNDKLQYFDGTNKGSVLLDSVKQICGSRVSSNVTANNNYTEGFFAAIDYDGNLYMWGENNSGELGNGTTQSATKPVKVEFETEPEQPTEPSTTPEQTKISFFDGDEISAHVGESKGVMVILDSAKYDFNDVNITSSNPDVVKINRIGIGDGPYFPEGNEKVATVYLEFVNVGSAALSVDIPDGTSKSLVVLSIEQEITKPGFTPKTDGWGFVNGEQGFNYSSTYHIPESIYEEVFGKSYTATAKANQGEIFNSMIDQSWGGNCYGMSVTACLFYLNMIEKGEYIDNNSNINSYYEELQYDNDRNAFYTRINNSKVSKLIEKYQILQDGSIRYDKGTSSTFNLIEGHYYFANEKKYRGWFKKTNTYEHIPEGDYIQHLLNIANNLDEPMVIGLSKGSGSSHAMVLRNDKKPKDLGNGWYAVYVYDPNHPYFNDELYSQCHGGVASYYINKDSNDTYIELNPSQNKWRYHGSLNSNSENSYWGCDSQGNIIMCSYGEEDGVVTYAPSIISFFSISNCNFPLEFNGTEPWTLPESGKTIVYLSSDSTLKIKSKDGDLLSEIVNGIPIDGVDDMDFYPNYHTSTNGSISSIGKLILPFTNFKVEYTSGSDITVVDNNSAINLSSEKEAVINVNMDSNEVQFFGNANSDVVAQITEVLGSDEYTSVVIDGDISRDDTVSVSLQDSNLNIDNQIQSDSTLSITTDNETEPEEKTIMTLTNDKNKGESIIEDVRKDNIVLSGTTGDCTWKLTDDGVLTISGNGAMGDYNNWSNHAPWGQSITDVKIDNGVTSIGDCAFYNCTILTSITIPDSITSIGGAAFYGCTGLNGVYISDVAAWCQISFSNQTGNPLGYAHNLYINNELVTDLEIPDSVTNIGYLAFFGCYPLKSVTIPSSVTNIGDDAFQGCSALTGVYISDISAWCRIKFNDSLSNPLLFARKLYINNNLVTKLVIPQGVTSIGNHVFSNCTALTNITIPKSVISIGDMAFNNCTGLTSVTIPDSVTNIGECAFEYCTNLTSIAFPDSVTSIGGSAFKSCTGLTSITFPDSVTSIGGSAFRSCTGLTSITIPESVTSIRYSTFENCTRLESVSIPDSVTSIESHAFTGTAWYNNQPDGLVYAGKVAYHYKGTIPNTVVLQNGTKGIAGLAFSSCTALTSITIPESVISIGDMAFYSCTGLTSVTIPDSVTSIGDTAFENCSSDFTIYGYRGSYAQTFAKKYGYIFVELDNETESSGITGDCIWKLTEDGVLTISGNGPMGDYAWNDELPWGTSIKKVVVQSGVTTIGSHAFYKCSDLSEVFLPNTLSEIKSSAFRWCSNLVCTELPEGLTVIKDNAFRDCSRLTEIVIPSSVNYIEELSFTNCEKLSTFYVSSNNPYFCSCDGLLYNKSSSELLYCPTAKTTVTIPEGVKKISRFAFHESKICSVVLPDSLDTIDYCSFRDCKYLQNIKFPNSITYIDGYAFAGCAGLTSVTISDSVTSIGKNAFSNCSSDLIIYGYSGSYAQTYANNNGLVFVELNNVTECSGITGDCTWKLTEDGVLTISGNGRMGDYSFENVAPWGTGVKKIIINDGVSNIGKCAFCKCTQLTDVSIPDSVESIDYSAFRLCDKLVNVALPKNLKSIGDYSFAWCESIKSITFSNELVSIGYMAFRACSELTEISIPSNVIYIEGGAFAWCINLSCINVESGNNKYDSRNNCNAIIETKTNKIIQSCNSTIIPNGIECIGDCAFLGCSKLDKITIPDSVTVIGESAFHSCLGLKKIVIPSTVVTLGGWSFAYCTYLTEIEIPKSVTSIGDDAFYASQKINIYGNVDSYAQLYANMYSIPFIEIKDTPFLAGDTNLDGKISISDVTEIQKYLAEIIDFSDEQLLLADTNGDGIISISDATHLQKYLAEFDGIVLGKQSA
ncbi:leucine-rich repeat protein [Lachnoclostridium sp. MSJ-17]|uniref:leucine-rich repeat protein n=1 Tax=Lachnoclostridium sp. MSJ-17 TaxID=2841516 RepID=UPI001C0FF7D0|nr:leucine-rich repeat protein [Lachnoclostridium sp. MSJ-17]MBU5461982.1 leucine-rich repeat protein [Lachnoclostridium sp. MSJ-17]